LKKHEIHHCSIAGDTRFDRVLKIAEKFEPIPFIENSLLEKKSLIAGSTWKEDEAIMKKAWDAVKDPSWKMVIAPHEINETHRKEIAQIFPEAVYYTLEKSPRDRTSGEVIVIDFYGILSKLYNYATITYIGGGFNKSGIHNTLEAAVFGKPVIFGPHYQKFREARELIACGGAFSFNTEAELKNILEQLMKNPQLLEAAGKASGNYVRNHAGATERIMRYIQENRLLTN
jgi:3-deoxy-D-manno-octulosonic-acid transferase